MLRAVVLLFLLLQFLPGSAQRLTGDVVAGDTSQLHGLGLMNRNFFTGTLIDATHRDSIYFQIKGANLMVVERTRVFDIVLLEADGEPQFRIPPRYTMALRGKGARRVRRTRAVRHGALTNNFLLPNALPRQAESIHYRTLWLLYHEFEYNPTEALQIGLIGILTTPPSGALFVGLKGKYVQPVRDKLHLGVGYWLLHVREPQFGFSPVEDPNNNVHFPHLLATAGDRQHNITFGYGFSAGRQTERVPDTGPVLFLGTAHTFGKHWRAALEVVIPQTGTTVQFGNLTFYRASHGTGRWEFGLLFFTDENFGAFPMVGWSSLF